MARCFRSELRDLPNPTVRAQQLSQNEYLMAENRILRNQIDGRVQLTDSDRKELS